MRKLVNVDLATGRETGRVTLEPGSVPIALSRDGKDFTAPSAVVFTDEPPVGERRKP